jgi:hypothetical protein
VAEERRAEEARNAEAARKAEEVRKAEEARRLEAARKAETDAARIAEEEKRKRALEAVAADETQVIAVQDPSSRRRVTDTAFDLERVDDRPHMIPGFDPEGGSEDTAEVPRAEGSPDDRTQALPRSAGADETQVLPPGETPPPRPGSGPGSRKR